MWSANTQSHSEQTTEHHIYSNSPKQNITTPPQVWFPRFNRVIHHCSLVCKTHIITAPYVICIHEVKGVCTDSKCVFILLCWEITWAGAGYLPSQEWLQTISQAASSQRSLADNKRDITLYITTLGSHKHNKSGAKSIKHREQMGGRGRAET